MLAFVLCGLVYVFVTADVQETNQVKDAEGQTHAVEEERQWEATEVKEADHVPDTMQTPDVPPPTPAKDQFQEELVIRPLHSGDIYASFQFRTMWDTDFLRGSKGII